MRPELVFRGAQQECAQNSNEISAFGPELVFRQVSRQFVERGGHPHRLRRRLGCVVRLATALIDSWM